MEKITIETLTAVVSGTPVAKGQAEYITGAGIDSRRIGPGDLFIPLVGERADGHDFIPTVAAAGAAAVLTEKELATYPDDLTVIRVASCEQAMKDIAAHIRGLYDLPVIAVTGSSGKTTTKDIIHGVLSQKYDTLKTQGNFNNELGIPLTLFNLESRHQAAVIEMGMDHRGEITASIDEVLPQVAVITNIGTAHLENLGSRENILAAKMEIAGRLKAGDVLLLNGDDPYLNTVGSDVYQIVRVAIDNEEADLVAEDVVSSSEGVRFKAGGEQFHFSIPGRHNVYNALMGIWLGHKLGLSSEEIQAGLAAFVPSANRMAVSEEAGVTLINDTYNANPAAMTAALGVLSDLAGEKRRRVAVLGDMLELGESSRQAHLEVGQRAREVAALLIAVGSEAKAYVAGFGGGAHLAADAEEAGRLLATLARPGDVILFKASRGIALEKSIPIFIEGFKEGGEVHD